MSDFKKGIRRYLATCTLLLAGMSATAAHADTVTELFNSTTLVTGTSLNLTELDLSSAGTLVIKLNDLTWPALFDVLSFSLTDATHVLQTYKLDSGAIDGAWTFNVTEPSTLYAAIFAKPSTTAKAGMYSVNVSYQTASPVPLPAAGWFLISGIAGLAALRPKQNAMKQKLSQSYA